VGEGAGATTDGAPAGIGPLRLLFHYSPVPQFVSRPDGSILAANPAYARLVGIDPEAAAGSVPSDVTHPDDLPRLVAAGRRLFDGEIDLLEVEVRIRRADGEVRWCLATSSLARDDDGRRLFVSHLLDVTDRKRAETELAVSQSQFRILADSLPVGVHQRDSHGRLEYVNRKWSAITGVPAEEALGHDLAELVHPDDRDLVLTASRRLAAEGGDYHQQYRIVRPDGTIRWVSSRSVWLPGTGGRPLAFVGSLEDITSLLEAQEEMTRLASIVETTSDLVGVVDARGWVVWANAAAREAYGLGDAALPIHSTKLYVPGSVDTFYSHVLPILLEGRTWSGELDMYRADGSVMATWQSLAPQLDAGGALVSIAAVGRDITDRKRLEADLSHRATHDVLTGLPNRALLLDRLERLVDDQVAKAGSVAVLFIDLDRFKAVNDALGHDAGDDLLRAVADRLSSVLRDDDVVARLGGDEFVVLCPGLGDEAEASLTAGRLLSVLSDTPVEVRGHRIPITASVGITVLTGAPDRHPEGLLREADAAMYRAKALGRDRFEVFDEALRAAFEAD
jgi:diguanylate cyclase (GGDEF)-like protein/PAS domain S-box-containing protein